MPSQIRRNESSIEVKREELIQHGMNVFQSVGAHYVCEVCIKSGNSCCHACSHLEEGIGCQRRNTACTAWLCGIQKFLFDHIGLIEEWENFWNQVPGQMFRKDRTPEKVEIASFLNIGNLDHETGQKLANILRSYVEQGGNLGKLERRLEKKYTLDNIERFEYTEDEEL
ncbi:DNA mismatch repair protein [Ectobacillus funiculus]|uniref:DNA mismatch repair protein n=1 Tax=Ectobacillus funiculus TaxID=137993 RepID=A0ABV5WII3_9BACI